MKKARYGGMAGPLVDPVEFLARATANHRQKGIFPYCDACGEVVHLYGVHTPNPQTTSRFDHPNMPDGADPLDDCILADRNPRFRGMQSDGYDDARGKVLRAQFFEPEFLAQAYAFCLNLCRARNIPPDLFRATLRRADKKRIWSYVGIPLWAVPYILLTLENFQATSKNGQEYGFHFVFQKPRGSGGTGIAALWSSQKGCKISKVFSDNGSPVRTGDNPYPVSEVAFVDMAGDSSWVTPALLRALIP